jgi:hypothetical protein
LKKEGTESAFSFHFLSKDIMIEYLKIDLRQKGKKTLGKLYPLALLSLSAFLSGCGEGKKKMGSS